MNDIKLKMEALNHICRVYQAHLDTLQTVCHRGCATCCTTGVVITSLEAWMIVEYLISQGLDGLFDRIKASSFLPRPCPSETLNRLARNHGRGILPEEEGPDCTVSCPLLTDNQCPIYPVRPFACRCLVSVNDCRNQGFALIDPFTVTVNQVMLQYIEHVDLVGVTGNMLDLVLCLQSEKDRQKYADGNISFLSDRFIVNSPAVVLMAGPGHKRALIRILDALNRG